MLPIKRKKTSKKKNIKLSDEQQHFIEKAIEGHNILVDACIGSGKTTSIQYLCDQIKDKKILYLTYNKLLKLDAKQKIKSKNTLVTNYHGFACYMLLRNNKVFSYSDSIQQFLDAKLTLPRYDILIIDEYQDIEQELADLLLYVKGSNPNMQIIAVGDMKQKIYDKTNLKVEKFIKEFLGEYLELEFTICFRLSSELAEMLGRVWKKKIVGINEKCEVLSMSEKQVEKFVCDKTPSDILCLGSRTGKVTKLLNTLEDKYPDKFNKKTVFASIRTKDASSTEPNKDSAIFTTFDACKGMEKPYCIIFDWTYDYWMTRIKKPFQSYEILRNIFCVAASRGKKKIIFVGNEKELLTEDVLSKGAGSTKLNETVLIDEMFDFKFREDIDKAYRCLNIATDSSLIKEKSLLNLKENDELIDLMPCISIYQKASYFKKYNIDNEIKLYLRANPDLEFLYKGTEKLSFDQKILIKVFLETQHNRYIKQVSVPFVSEKEKKLLHTRLSLLLDKNVDVQISSEILFKDQKGKKAFTAVGLADVVKDGIVYCLHYSHSISEVNCLVCACYIYALKLKKGIVWNVYDNSIYEISIKNNKSFMDNVTRTITKGNYKKYY